MNEAPLIAVVPKPSADQVIEDLKAADAYDADRRIRRTDDEMLAIPVSRRPDWEVTIRTDDDPAYRVRDLEDRLQERGFTEEELDHVPTSWAVLGTILLARFEDCPRETEVGEAMLELHTNADTVLAREGIHGPHREPAVRVVAGVGDTETIHREHGTAYAMDLSTVMFSPGNKAERVRMGETVAADERVFDMFAGIGYFTLPMARAGATVVATERNPTAFRYLLENAKLNEVTDRVEAYRADCRALDPRVDRVVMGHYDAVEYLASGIAALRPGGTLHLHHVAEADDPFAEARRALERADADLSVVNTRVVKSTGPGAVHVVVDAERRSG